MAKIIQKTLPNILTSFRCISALIVPFLIVYGDEIGAVLAPVIFIIACFTDFFDGYFARKYNVVSNYGRIIDPIADKMLVVGTLFALCSENFFNYHYTFIPTFLIIIREIFISGLREQVATNKSIIHVSILAKWKTTFQMIACSSYLILRSHEYFFNSLVVEYICIMLIWFAAFITIITCYDYLKQVWSKL